jgi:oligogalacturonide lyase
MNLKTGEIKFIVNVGFQIGHVQSNPWMPGEIVFCWETTGKAPQRTWIVKSDGTGLRPLYGEAPYEWITHEAVIGKDEAVIAILGHRQIGAATPDSDWGIAGTMEHPTGVGIVNLRTREMRIVGQVPVWAPGRSDWHVAGSADGRWAASDDFSYEVWLIDRHSGEMNLLAGPQHAGADHIHPTFNADGTKIEIQSALISKDNRSLNICIVPVPRAWLNRTYSKKAPE